MLFAADVLRYSADNSPIALAVDLVHEDPPAWLPSFQRGQDTSEQVIEVGEAILDEPALIWQAISDPYVSAWAECRYGEAIGRGVFEVGTALLPAGLAARLATLSRASQVSTFADVLTVLRRGEAVAPEEYAGTLARLVEEARANRNVEELLEAARQADSLDELVAYGGLTSAEIALLPEAARAALLLELAANGIRHSPEAILRIDRDVSGRIVFLETGGPRAGLEHIQTRHAADFERIGVARDEISDVVFDATVRGEIVAYQGRETGRPIYRTSVNGRQIDIAITIGDNGFIVGANPVSSRH